MNIISENIATVINNLTSIISTANVTDDQNIDNGNVRTVKTVLAQTASLLRSPVMVTSQNGNGNIKTMVTSQLLIKEAHS